MPLSIDVKPIQQTQEEIPYFVAWLNQFIQAMRRVWKKESRRSRPAKNFERRW